MKFIAGNWKMNLGVRESIQLTKELKKTLKAAKNAVAVFPPFTSLYPVSKEIEGSGIVLGAQNMHFEDNGAYTGEISPLMLKESGCKYVIIGHSERRFFFNESGEFIRKKVSSAISHGIIPILCVGENLDEREKGLQNNVVKSQLLDSIKNIEGGKIGNIIIAYEPVWAIGTGKTATPEQAEEMHSFIRKTISISHGAVSSKIKIIYGGSVNASNSESILSQKNVDGALVGGASLKAESFSKIAFYGEE